MTGKEGAHSLCLCQFMRSTVLLCGECTQLYKKFGVHRTVQYAVPWFTETERKSVRGVSMNRSPAASTGSRRRRLTTASRAHLHWVSPTHSLQSFLQPSQFT